MRPKKRVLLYCADEWRASVTTFLLQTKGYAVGACDSLEAAVYLAGQRYDVALVAQVKDEDVELVVAAVKRTCRETPVLLVLNRDSGLLPRHTTADRVVGPAMDTACLLEAIRIAVSRKRGPRPAWKLALQEVTA